MEVDHKFVSAYIDNGNIHRVLGVRLRPFCAWHLFQFQIIESPFINAGEVYLYDIRRAVGICRLQFPNCRTRPPIFPLVMNQEKLERAVNKFVTYLGDYIQKPDYSVIPIDEFSTRSTRAPRKLTPAPEVVQLAYDAAHGANITVAEAWNMPIGQAYVSQAMYYKKQGMQVDFMDEAEREFQAALKEHLESRNGAK